MSQALFLNTGETGLNMTDKVPALKELILEEKKDDKQTISNTKDTKSMLEHNNLEEVLNI